MKRTSLILLVFALFSLGVQAIDNLSIFTRNTISLDGDWKYVVDPYENGYYNYRHVPFDESGNPNSTGYYGDKKMELPSDLIEYNFDKSPSLQVPGDWNTQDEKLYFYEGTIWYRKKFESPERKEDERVFLYFGAVNYRADVYLNAKKLGVHIGGFTPFYYEITELLEDEENSLVVKVDNKRLPEGVPTDNTDWWNYGGITRSVKMMVVPNTFIKDYQIALNSIETNIIEGSLFIQNADEKEKVTLSIPELKKKVAVKLDQNGGAKFSFTAKNISYWTPENPKLYELKIHTEQDTLTDYVGFRTIETQGKKILLNGEEIFLGGICIHEENAANGGGRVNSPEKAEQLLEWALELGCNFVRLAHYPHSEEMVRIAEKKGLMVWSEIPVYWTIHWNNSDTYANAVKQLQSNILRDRNRANIIIWSLANETPVNKTRTEFLKKMANHARQLDGTRLLSAAMEKHYKNETTAIVEDPLADIVDIVAFNQYTGWYDGLPEKCDRITWEINYDKPVFISEFGAGAKFNHHGDANQRWTEEFQADLYTRSLKMIDQIDGLCGISPWILTDFRSPRRMLPEIQDGFNRKGLLSEKGEKKQAFSIVKEYYKQKAAE